MEDYSNYHININRVAQDRTMMSITRMLATDLLNTPYMSVGDFMKNVPDAEVQMLIDLIESGDEDPRFSELLLISQMLYTAEGLGVHMGTIDEATDRVNALIGFVLVESLARKGLAVAHHEHMSFDESMKDKIIASPPGTF